MGLDKVFEIFGFFEISKQFEHVLLDYFFGEVVEQALHKFSHLTVGRIGYLEALDIRLARILQLHPANVQLPL